MVTKCGLKAPVGAPGNIGLTPDELSKALGQLKSSLTADQLAALGLGGVDDAALSAALMGYLSGLTAAEREALGLSATVSNDAATQAAIADVLTSLSPAQLAAIADALIGQIGATGAQGLAGALAALTPAQMAGLADAVAGAMGPAGAADIAAALATLANAQLAPLNITSTLVDNGDNSYTYTDETGAQTTFTVPSTAGVDWAALTPADVSAMAQAILDGGGAIHQDAFGVSLGVIIPMP